MTVPTEPERAPPGRARRWLVRLVGLGLGTYVAVLLLMMLFENALVYHPTPAADYWLSPPVPDMRDVLLSTAENEAIHGWWLPCAGSTGALLYLHGNAGNLSMRSQSVLELRRALNLAVLIIDYPGFGKSTGVPSEQGCYRAGEAAYAWLVHDQQIAPRNVVLFGKSLGGGVATYLASRHDCRALALIKTYTTLPDVAHALYPWAPAHWLMRNRFDSMSRIADCHCPVFVAHGDADRLIPIALGQQLYAAAPEPKQFLTLPGAGHNDPLPPELYRALRDFLEHHPAR